MKVTIHKDKKPPCKWQVLKNVVKISTYDKDIYIKLQDGSQLVIPQKTWLDIEND